MLAELEVCGFDTQDSFNADLADWHTIRYINGGPTKRHRVVRPQKGDFFAASALRESTCVSNY